MGLWIRRLEYATKGDQDEAWAASYRTFNDFRTAIAEAVGIKLAEMVGYGGMYEFDSDEPLRYLLSHADNEGLLSDYECGQMAPRLRELAPHLGGWRLDAEHMADVFERCANDGGALKFE